MDLTPWYLPHGAYTIEGTSFNLHIGRYLVEHTSWKLPSGTLDIGSYLMEHTPWKLPHTTYTLAVTYSNKIRGCYLEEFTSC